MANTKNKAPAPKSLFHSYRKILHKQFGIERGSIICKSFAKRYTDLYAGRRVFANKALNFHLTKNILSGIALYDAIVYSGFSEKDALVHMEVFYNSLYQRTALLYRMLGRMPLFFQLLGKLAARSMSVTYPKEGWTTSWIENSPKRIAFDVSRCFYQDILKEYHHEVLLPCFCRIDDVVYGRISPRVEWKRSTTLGSCGPVCDFRFIAREKTDEK